MGWRNWFSGERSLDSHFQETQFPNHAGKAAGGFTSFVGVAAVEAKKNLIDPALDKAGDIAQVFAERAKPALDPLMQNARIGAGHVVGAARGVASPMVQRIRVAKKAVVATPARFQDRIADSLRYIAQSIALKLSFSSACAVMFFIGLFGSLGIDSLELVDRASIVEAITMHAIVVATILVLVWSILFQYKFEQSFVKVLPYVAPLLVCAFWLTNGVSLIILLAASIFLLVLGANVDKNAVIVGVVLCFAMLGAARADRLAAGPRMAELVRFSSLGQERNEDVTIVLSGDKGVLLISGQDRNAPSYEFLPWDSVKQLLHRPPAQLLWTRMRSLLEVSTQQSEVKSSAARTLARVP